MISSFRFVAGRALDARAWRPSHCALLLDAHHARSRNIHAGYSDDDHLHAVAEWLERAQDAQPDGGISGRFSLRTGWSSSYPETTGYIVPTFLALAQEHGLSRFGDRAERAVRFLLEIQLENGAFPGMEIAENRTDPSVFNSAQIICGLRAWHAATGDEPALIAACRAADWIVEMQDGDGAWRRHLYGETPYTYMAHAACWVTELGEYLQEARYLEAGRRHLQWVLQHYDAQTQWFDLCGFSPDDHRARQSVTHTLAYTLWGTLLMSQILGDSQGLEAVRGVARRVARRLELSRRLPGMLDSKWRGRSDWSCLTGNSQMALVWLRLHCLQPELPLVSAALKAIDLVKRAQPMASSNPGIRGGIPGSDPVSGGYIYMALPNWAAKFHVDSLLAKRQTLANLAVPRVQVSNATDIHLHDSKSVKLSRPKRDVRVVLLASATSPKVRAFHTQWRSWGFRPAAVVVERPRRERIFDQIQRVIEEGGASGLLTRAATRLRWPGSSDGGTERWLGDDVLQYCRVEGIRVVEVTSFTDSGSLAQIRTLGPDLFVHAGAGILREELLGLPRLGTLNAHMGLLPTYRGMNTAEWARLEGRSVGCSVHLVDAGIDTGAVLARRAVDTSSTSSVSSLRRCVDQAQIALLGDVVRYVCNTGILPPQWGQAPEQGRQYFTIHEALREKLDRALSESEQLSSDRKSERVDAVSIG